MSIKAVKLEMLYITMNDDAQDTTKVKEDIDRFIKQWKDIGLPLKENGGLQLHEVAYKNF